MRLTDSLLCLSLVLGLSYGQEEQRISEFELDTEEAHTPNGVKWDVGQAVRTSSGTIIGHAASTRLAVSEYLGIPFANPPVGELRFAAPQPYEGRGTINASAFVSVISFEA